jgi:hypothetical protein
VGVGGGLLCLWRGGRRAITGLQLLVPLELGSERVGVRAVQFGTHGHPTSTSSAVEVAVGGRPSGGGGGRWPVGRRPSRPWAVCGRPG